MTHPLDPPEGDLISTLEASHTGSVENEIFFLLSSNSLRLYLLSIFIILRLSHCNLVETGTNMLIFMFLNTEFNLGVIVSFEMFIHHSVCCCIDTTLPYYLLRSMVLNGRKGEGRGEEGKERLPFLLPSQPT